MRSTERQVVAAIEALRDGGRAQPEDMSRLTAQLLTIGMFAGDRQAWERINELIGSPDDELVDEQTRIYANTCSDVVRHGAGWAGPVGAVRHSGLHQAGRRLRRDRHGGLADAGTQEPLRDQAAEGVADEDRRGVAGSCDPLVVLQKLADPQIAERAGVPAGRLQGGFLTGPARGVDGVAVSGEPLSPGLPTRGVKPRTVDEDYRDGLHDRAFRRRAGIGRRAAPAASR
ncbi:hypothetical protein ABIA31_008732 [Catenulispora sp. MAP5-51]